MKTLPEFVLEELSIYGDELMLEMANLSQKDTNLPMMIWIEPSRKTNHNKPRLKFENSYSKKLIPKELIPISIDKDNPEILVDGFKLKIKPKDIDILKEWIKKYYKDLMDVWNYKINLIEFHRRLF